MSPQHSDAPAGGMEWVPPLIELPSVDELTRAGEVHLDAGRPKEAIELLTDALVQDPHDCNIRLLLGAAYEQAGDLVLAADVLESALRLDPSRADVHARLGRLLEQTGNQEGAAAAYQHSLQVDPTNAAARTALSALRPDLSLPDPSALDPALLCRCPACDSAVMRHQPGLLCPVCGANLASVFKGTVAVTRDYTGAQTFRCSHCQRALVHLNRACPDCSLDFITGDLPVPTPARQPLAPFPRRVWATYLDRLVALPFTFIIVNGMVSSLDPLVYPENTWPALRTHWVIILASLLAAVLDLVTAPEWGASVGKKMMKLGVEYRSSIDVSMVAAMARASVKWGVCSAQTLLIVHLLPVSLGLLAWWLPSISELWGLVDRNQHALHDLSAGTTVVDGWLEEEAS